jgi:hypothetical protein
MNIREKITAATGSIVLNLALALVLGQGAGAATPAAMQEVKAAPPTAVAYGVENHEHATQHCRSSLRTRALVAVLLGMIV